MVEVAQSSVRQPRNTASRGFSASPTPSDQARPSAFWFPLHPLFLFTLCFLFFASFSFLAGMQQRFVLLLYSQIKGNLFLVLENSKPPHSNVLLLLYLVEMCIEFCQPIICSSIMGILQELLCGVSFSDFNFLQ